VLLAATAGTGAWTPERIVGLVVIALAITLLTVARFNLGSSFSVTPQTKKLVTKGVYSRVRHPVYVFSAVARAGLALYLERPVFLSFLIVLIPIQVARARKESQKLEEKFGEEYQAWKLTTWF
jgi:protein-S-isoprenylcysteine O-methyltransferase Ste14